jgi:hypothetical protein
MRVKVAAGIGGLLAAAALFGTPARSWSDPERAGLTASARPGASPLVDRVVARWYAPETGGVEHPQFVFERELAFAARIEALADPDAEPGAYSDRHVRAALDRHIAETLLSHLPIVPAPLPREIAARAEAARGVLEQRTHGRARLAAAAAAEGISSDEIDTMLRRQARASLYLDRMVAPMLEPSELELRALLRSGSTPFSGQPFERVRPVLERWVVGQRVSQALEVFSQNARPRLTVTFVRTR